MRQTQFQTIHFTGEGFRRLSVYRLFFKHWLAHERNLRADYEAEVRDWYENGDGASPQWVEAGTQPWFDPENDDPSRMVNIGGRGYRFPYCIHGSDLTTDYDNICYGCEESATVIEIARGYAREQFLRFVDRWEWVNSAPGDLSYDTRNELLEWAVSLFPKKDD